MKALCCIFILLFSQISGYDWNFDDNLWIDFNFPIAAGDVNVSEQCLHDTRMQLSALRDDLPWAVQSQYKRLHFIINNFI